MELDVLMQTIRKTFEAPIFEGVSPDDCRYSLIYASAEEKILVIFPSNIIIQYDSTNGELLTVT